MNGTARITKTAAGGVRIAIVIPNRGGDPIEILVTGTPTETAGEYLVQVDPGESVRRVVR